MPSDAEQIIITGWHFDRLVDLGAESREAWDAVERGVDWHDVNDLVEAGCPVKLALEIA